MLIVRAGLWTLFIVFICLLAYLIGYYVYHGDVDGIKSILFNGMSGLIGFLLSQIKLNVKGK